MGIRPRRCRRLAAALGALLTVLAGLSGGAGEGGAGPAPEPRERLRPGRLLYANDDDWDWAAPQGKETTRLAEYGRMAWSALDWIEEGLAAVRGLAVGSLPLDYLAPAGSLDKARGDDGRRRHYEEVGHEAGLLARRLKPGAEGAPDVVLLMRNSSDDPEPAFGQADLDAVRAFLRRGGRVIVLDDWGAYRPVLEAVLAEGDAGKPVRPAAGQEALRKKVLELVKLLGADEWAVREKATTDLIALGPDVVDVLAGVASDDPEVRERLRRVTAATGRRGGGQEDESRSLSDEQVEALLARAKRAGKSAEVRKILRNGNQEPGRALVMEFAAEHPEAGKQEQKGAD